MGQTPFSPSSPVGLGLCQGQGYNIRSGGVLQMPRYHALPFYSALLNSVSGGRLLHQYEAIDRSQEHEQQYEGRAARGHRHFGQERHASCQERQVDEEREREQQEQQRKAQEHEQRKTQEHEQRKTQEHEQRKAQEHEQRKAQEEH